MVSASAAVTEAPETGLQAAPGWAPPPVGVVPGVPGPGQRAAAYPGPAPGDRSRPPPSPPQQDKLSMMPSPSARLLSVRGGIKPAGLILVLGWAPADAVVAATAGPRASARQIDRLDARSGALATPISTARWTRAVSSAAAACGSSATARSSASAAAAATLTFDRGEWISAVATHPSSDSRQPRGRGHSRMSPLLVDVRPPTCQRSDSLGER